MRRSALSLPLLLVLSASSAGGVSTVQDQSDVDVTTRFAISTFLAAVDLNFTPPVRLDTLTVWLTDNVVNNNGQLDGFVGALSWALMVDQSGPGDVYASGLDQTPEIVDTGLQTSDGHDILRVTIDLDGEPVLDGGPYWLAIHEGVWGSAADATPIYWLAAASTNGSNAWVTADEVDPNPGEWVVSLHDAAIVAEGDPFIAHRGGIDTTTGDPCGADPATSRRPSAVSTATVPPDAAVTRPARIVLSPMKVAVNRAESPAAT